MWRRYEGVPTIDEESLIVEYGDGKRGPKFQRNKITGEWEVWVD